MSTPAGQRFERSASPNNHLSRTEDGLQNIEIKARYPDLAAARRFAESAGARHAGDLHQIDIYFVVPGGRLKLREINGREAQLIYYQRADSSGPSTSDYHIAPVTDPGTLKIVLRQALGVWRTVEKTRQLYLYDEVRIHLDQVSGLGNFIEFEGVVAAPELSGQAQTKVAFLTNHFQIPSHDLVAGSYSDLMD